MHLKNADDRISLNEDDKTMLLNELHFENASVSIISTESGIVNWSNAAQL